jgi:hypothetical protein
MLLRMYSISRKKGAREARKETLTFELLDDLIQLSVSDFKLSKVLSGYNLQPVVHY